MRRTPHRLSVVCLAPLLLVPGCRSAFISATLRNKEQQPVKLVEIDYPSASFGVSTLAAGGEFHYRFKVQGSGALKLEFTDAAGKVHDATGPNLQEGQAGNLSIEIAPSGEVYWAF